MATYNIEMNTLNSSGSYDQLYPQTLINNISDWNSVIYSKEEIPNIIESQLPNLSYSKCVIGSYVGTSTQPRGTNGSFTASTYSYIYLTFVPKLLVIRASDDFGFGYNDFFRENGGMDRPVNAFLFHFPYKPIPVEDAGQKAAITLTGSTVGVRNITYSSSNGNTTYYVSFNYTGTTYYYLAIG